MLAGNGEAFLREMIIPFGSEGEIFVPQVTSVARPKFFLEFEILKKYYDALTITHFFDLAIAR